MSETPPCPGPQLDLSFRHHPGRGTFLDRRRFRWPFTLARTFRLDAVPAGMVTLILQTVSGAIQAGDTLSQRIHLGPEAAAHVTTQGATAVFRAPPGMEATDDLRLDVEAGAFLEYLPEPRILFPDAALSQRVVLRLGADGMAVLSDAFLVHDPDGGTRDFRHFAAETRIERADGTLLAVDRLVLDGLPRRSGRRAPFAAFGTLMFAGLPAGPAPEDLCGAIEARTAALPGLYAAASLLPNEAGVALKLCAPDGRHLRLGLEAGWFAFRHHLFGRAPASRRKEAQ